MRFQSRTTTDPHAAQSHSPHSSGQLFVTATLLARKARYADATKILRRASEAGDCSEAEALDLQARMYAQQGLYLEAEKCWRQAKSRDAVNEQYDNALARLRRGRLATGRGLHILIGIIVFTIMGLMVWQVFFATPDLARKLNQQRSALASLQTSVDTTADAAGTRDTQLAASVGKADANAATRNAELAASIEKINEEAAKRDAQLAEAVALLVTSQDAASNRETVLKALSTAAADLRKTNEASADRLFAQQTETEAAAQNRMAALTSSISALADALGSTKAALTERIDANDAATAKRLDQAIAGVSRRIDGLPASESIAVLEGQIRQLKEQVAAVAAAMEELWHRQSEETEAGDVCPATALPVDTPEPAQTVEIKP